MTEYRIDVFCPHTTKRGDQKVIAFIYDDPCPKWCEGQHDLGAAHLSPPDESGTCAFQPNRIPAEAWEGKRAGASTATRRARNLLNATFEDLYGDPRVPPAPDVVTAAQEAVAVAQAGAAEIPDDFVVRSVSPTFGVQDGEGGMGASDAHHTYRIACSLCGTNLLRTHDKVWPVLEELRIEGHTFVTRVYFEARLQAYARMGSSTNR